MEEYQSDFKYVAMKALLKRMLQVKTPEALMWRRLARRYLEDFPLQWEHRDLPTWNIDTEVFEKLQRQAQSIMIDL